MTFHRALSGLLVTAVFGACAVQVDEPTRNGEPIEPTAGKGGSTTAAGGSGSVSGKGGTTSVTGGGSGGSTTSGKGGSAGATAGKGGAPTAGATNGGTGGSAGSDGAGTSGSAGGPSGGSVGSTSCDGLPEWAAGAQPPNPPMKSGAELTFNAKKWLYTGSGDLWNFDGGCPPETIPERAREPWCDTSAQNTYMLVGPCE